MTDTSATFPLHGKAQFNSTHLERNGLYLTSGICWSISSAGGPSELLESGMKTLQTADCFERILSQAMLSRQLRSDVGFPEFS